MYIDDPTALFAPLEETWDEYIARGDELIQQVESTVVEWRLADWDLYPVEYLPVHPFWRTIDVRDVTGRWRARPVQWVEEDAAKGGIVRYGFDAEGRMVLFKEHRYKSAVIYGDGWYDIVEKYPNLHVGMDTSYAPPRGNERVGGFERFHVDEKGRITASLKISNFKGDPDSHYRDIEQFDWQGDRLVTSYKQSFNFGTSLPEVTKRNPAERVARLYRRVNDKLREGMYGRHRITYSYGDDGVLAAAEEFDELDGDYTSLYARKSNDTIESVVDEMAAAVAKAVVKLVKDTKAAHPVRRVALLYLSQHAHCGLPTYVRMLGANDVIQDPVRDDPYPHLTPWPHGQPRKVSSCQARLMALVEDNPLYETDFAPRPYREMLWKASRAVQKELVGKKRIVADDFAVYPVDQHGDASAAEDIRESVPSELADQVIQDAQRH